MSETLVMIVDDEKGLLMLFSNLIKRLGYTVIEADGGQAAIDLLHEVTPDLLVLDLAMPKVSGHDVLRYIQNTDHLDDMQVMVLTALGPGAVRDSTSSRVDRWVNKPLRPDAFIDHIQDMLTGAAE